MTNQSVLRNIENELYDIVSKNHLLKHEFYQLWQDGLLPKKSLQHYAKQYYHFEAHFSRILSTIHAQCDDLETRQAVLSNMYDEENGDENHVELWLRFAEGLGVNRNDVVNSVPDTKTQELLDTYYTLSESSPEEGMAAMFAYEGQVPAVAETKIEGLKKFYDVNDERTLSFHKVHMVADEYHAQASIDVIKKLPEKNQNNAKIAVEKAAKALNGFLDGVNEHRKMYCMQ